MTFSRAIARTPCERLAAGIASADRGTPDHRRALAQHAAYVEALERLGVAVTVLSPLDAFPDSTFVEDVAVCLPDGAVITRPGAPARRGETEHVTEALAAAYSRIDRIEAPGTLDGGDVMLAGSHAFIGLTARTNETGAQQLIAILERHGMTGSTVAVGRLLHLKSGAAWLGNDTLLAVADLARHPGFRRFSVIEVADDEAYAANSLWVNGTVLMADGFPATRRAVEDAGYPVIELDTSEFRKLDGGLSCLSLRW